MAIKRSALNSQVGYMLRRAQMVVFAEFIEALQSLHLRPGHFSVLQLVGEHDGLTQSQLGEALGIQRTNLVAVIDELERRGWVLRGPSSTDRRSHRVVITVEGRRMLERATALQENQEAALKRRLGRAGHAQLLRLLAKLVDIPHG